MHNKLSIYLKLSKLKGAFIKPLKGKSGEVECLIIPIRADLSRLKVGKNGDVGIALDAVPNRDGKDQFDQTHWVAESRPKAERELDPESKTEIIGNAKEWDDGPKANPQKRLQGAGGADFADSVSTEGMGDDEIPF